MNHRKNKWFSFYLKIQKLDFESFSHSGQFQSLLKCCYNTALKILAERKGFEPSIRFWRIHTFQACAFDHSATSLLIIGPVINKTKIM